MKNRIIYINQNEMKEIKKHIYAKDNTFCVELDGKKCIRLSMYLTEISNKLNFPMMAKNLDGYDDWITDLTWISEDGVAIIINHYKEFLCLDLKAKEKIIESFEQLILPWWEEDVCNCVVGGKTKEFVVYLVD